MRGMNQHCFIFYLTLTFALESPCGACIVRRCMVHPQYACGDVFGDSPRLRSAVGGFLKSCKCIPIYTSPARPRGASASSGTPNFTFCTRLSSCLEAPPMPPTVNMAEKGRDMTNYDWNFELQGWSQPLLTSFAFLGGAPSSPPTFPLLRQITTCRHRSYTMSF